MASDRCLWLIAHVVRSKQVLYNRLQQVPMFNYSALHRNYLLSGSASFFLALFVHTLGSFHGWMILIHMNLIKCDSY